MIKIQFKDTNGEKAFFKNICFWSRLFNIRYAEMVPDIDLSEKEKDVKDEE